MKNYRVKMKNYRVVGYAGDASLPDIREGDALKLTHLNVAFGHVKEDQIHIDHLQNLDQLEKLKRVNSELTILLSVGGWTYHSTICWRMECWWIF